MGRNSNAAKKAENEWSRWYLIEENMPDGSTRFSIKRYRRFIEDGKTKTAWERYPAKAYRNLPETEVQSLLRRINATHQSDAMAAAARYTFDHSYINQISVEKFRKQLDKKSRVDGHKDGLITLLNDYIFEFFVLQCKLPDPSRWHLKEDEWKDFLLMQDLSSWSLKRIVGTANRFNKFLVDKMYPEMPTPRKLEPFGKVDYDKMDKERGTDHRTKYITEEMFKKIIEAANKEKTGHPEIVPNMILCYNFGLRISESLGLTKDKFFKEYLLVDEQGDQVEILPDGTKAIKRDVVKTSSRQVPYWNMSAKEAWALVKQIRTMHPCTLMDKVNAVMNRFGHKSHDFRRTFITNAFRKDHHWKDVMKAAGHKDVRTTMIYNQDDRGFQDKKADLDD